jgi:protocatechuate 3,4-dioxygenase beta subunit
MTRFAFALAIATLPLAAQTSSLQGIVTDAQGAAVPGAVITAINKDTSSVRKTITDTTGAYSMLQVAPGPYKVTVEKPSFRTHNTELVLMSRAKRRWSTPKTPRSVILSMRRR